MTDADPTMVRPREELARFLVPDMFDDRPPEGHREGQCPDCDFIRTEAREKATAVLNRLRELGAFNDQFYDAIKKEAGK